MLKTVCDKLTTPFQNKNEIPAILSPYKAIVAAIMTEQGDLIDANAGFHFLFRHLSTDELYSKPLAAFFLSPSFDELTNVQEHDDDVIYNGLLTLGDPYSESHSLLATVYGRDERLYLMGEHNIEEMEHLNESVLKLNEKMANMQRKLASSNHLLELQKAEATRLMLTDELTELPNRRAYMAQMKQAMAFTSRQQNTLSLALIDIDFFKQVNDTYGHETGDSALRTFAMVLKNNLRESDFIARIGGEEFAVIMPATELGDAVELMNRVRETVAKLVPPLMTRALTASFGVVSYDSRTGNPAISAEQLLGQADVALYKAKQGGRNQVIAYHH